MLDRLSGGYICVRDYETTLEVNMKHQAQFRVCGSRLMMVVDGRQHQLRYSTGARYLLRLMQQPGKEFYALSLSKFDQEIPLEYAYLSKSSEAERMQFNLFSMDCLPPIAKADPLTLRQVSARLNQVIQQEALAREDNNHARLDELLEEKEKRMIYRSEVLRENGQMRYFRGNESKAIQSVNKALQRVINRISELEAELGQHLKQNVSTWHRIYYIPGDWEVVVSS